MLLCTLDRKHQVFTRFARSWFAVNTIGRLPFSFLAVTLRLFRDLTTRRNGRREHSANGIVNDAVESVFRSGADVVLCGHVHIREERMYQLEHGECSLYVLDRWDRSHEYIVAHSTADRLERKTWKDTHNET